MSRPGSEGTANRAGPGLLLCAADFGVPKAGERIANFRVNEIGLVALRGGVELCVEAVATREWQV